MTNLLASIIVTLATNVFQPTQYLVSNYGCLVMGCNADHSQWVDTPSPIWNTGLVKSQTRLNPDVRITEVRRIRELRFSFEDKDYVELLSNEIVSSKKETRTVTTREEWK